MNIGKGNYIARVAKTIQAKGGMQRTTEAIKIL
jgi:hypothetical protein